ncbi:NUDIX domain-containing protein [bacterium]|nr:NUDIX domain-containing protein [bacterium]
MRETFEETGVEVKVLKPVGYMQTTVISAKPDDFPYPYPQCHMAFYFCEAVSESDFNGNDETHGRAWLPLDELDTSAWCVKNKVFLDAILENNLSHVS